MEETQKRCPLQALTSLGTQGRLPSKGDAQLTHKGCEAPGEGLSGWECAWSRGEGTGGGRGALMWMGLGWR